MTTSTQRTKALRERRAKLGMTRHEHYYHKDNHKKVVKYIAGLNSNENGTNDEVTKYWLNHYCTVPVCELCGDTGVINGYQGKLCFCICPKGQSPKIWPL